MEDKEGTNGTKGSISLPPVGVVVFQDKDESSRRTTINVDAVAATLPLPSSSVFSLQPRRNIPTLMCPPRSCHRSSALSTPSRGRKRDSQSLTSPPLHTVSRSLFSPVNCSTTRIFRDHDESFNGSIIASPIPVHRAMQSMSIKSPFSVTSSPASHTTNGRTEFVLLSPSSSFQPRSRSGSFASFDSSNQASSLPKNALTFLPKTARRLNSSIRNEDTRKETDTETRTSVFTPSTPSTRASFVISRSNNDDAVLSTPLSQLTNITTFTPSTPASVRTLPSPHNTPLPRAMRLTPRRRCLDQENMTGNDTPSSIFLSPRRSKNDSSRNSNIDFDGRNVFSFEDGIGSNHDPKQPTVSRSSSYMPSPYSWSRSSVTGRTNPSSSPTSSTDRYMPKSFTMSLLGPPKNSNNLDFMTAANARATAALNCGDESLSDKDDDYAFVLANPVALAQEQDSKTMSAPRPRRRRRMSPPTDVVFDKDDNHTVSERKVNMNSMDQFDHRASNRTTTLVGLAIMGIPLTKDDDPTSRLVRVDEVMFPKNKKTAMHGKGRNDASSTFHSQKLRSTTLAVSGYDDRHFDWMESIRSHSSLLDNVVPSPSSAMKDFECIHSRGKKGLSFQQKNEKPYTSPIIEVDSTIDSITTLSSNSTAVRISRSDPNNVHSTIADMAAAHEHSPRYEHCSPRYEHCSPMYEHWSPSLTCSS